MATNVPATDVKADPFKPVKAALTLVGVFITALLSALTGPETLSSLSAEAWLTVILGTLVTSGLVYGVPNPLSVERRR